MSSSYLLYTVSNNVVYAQKFKKVDHMWFLTMKFIKRKLCIFFTF